MNDILKENLNQLRSLRMRKFGNVAYQKLTSDYHFENVPSELRELWYSPYSLSFVTLSNITNSQIDYVSTNELVCLIDNECNLIVSLCEVFADLEKQKAGI
jgi:hypothetical protein